MYNFTLIIPTHNRHHYLDRSIAYFKNLEADVIYCDSSEIAYSANFSSNMTYMHMPNKTFADKILIALNQITTDYSALCADDDFIVIESLYQGVDFLSEDRNYNTVVGKYIAFKEKFSGDYYKIYQEPPQDLDFSPTKNAEVFFQHYYQILWAMYKKEILIKAFQIINQAHFENDNFIEMVIGACACYMGGIKFLDTIWGVRELTEQDHWGTRHLSITNIQGGEIKQDYNSFKYLLNQNTNDGFAEVVMKNYLKFSKKPNNYLFKTVIKDIIPLFLLKHIQKHTTKTNYKNTYESNNLGDPTLKDITKILNSSNMFSD